MQISLVGGNRKKGFLEEPVEGIVFVPEMLLQCLSAGGLVEARAMGLAETDSLVGYCHVGCAMPNFILKHCCTNVTMCL